MIDDTINIETDSEEREFIRTGFDLVVTSPDGEQKRIPVCHHQLKLGCSEEKGVDILLAGPGIAPHQATLAYQQGQLFFTNVQAGNTVLVNGQTATFCELNDQDELQLAGYRIRIVSLMEALATLEGYTGAYRGRHWAIGKDPVPIGRAGKRPNKVELDDRTVSRTQCTIRFLDSGFFLEPETRNSPIRVNGEKVVQARVLADGDLIQLGQQLLRFRTAKGSSRPRNLIPQEATILFSDIWNYSTLSESRPLEETINQMNEFYRAMGKVIEAEGGLLMTFLGDAMMAVFGAEKKDEQDPSRAVTAALKMQERLNSLNEEWAGQEKPTMRIGVGINTGEVMVGDVGFTGKFEFAAMGDNTNLAARLEKLTREYDAKVIISGSTRDTLDENFLTESLGATKVKGRETPVQLYKVTGVAD